MSKMLVSVAVAPKAFWSVIFLVIVDGIHSLFQEYQQRLVINIFCSDGVKFHRLNQDFNCAELSPDCLDVVLEALHFVHYHGCFC